MQSRGLSHLVLTLKMSEYYNLILESGSTVLVTRFLLFEDREAALPLEVFIQGLVTRLEWYLHYRYFTHDLSSTGELTK